MAKAAYVEAWCKLSTGILPKIDFKGIDPAPVFTTRLAVALLIHGPRPWVNFAVIVG